MSSLGCSSNCTALTPDRPEHRTTTEPGMQCLHRVRQRTTPATSSLGRGRASTFRRMSPLEARTVDRDPVHVRYVEVADDAQAIAAGWASLEDAVGTMRGRRFLAVIADDRYRACVEQITDVTTAEQRLPTLVVPGGTYRRVRLHGGWRVGLHGSAASAPDRQCETADHEIHDAHIVSRETVVHGASSRESSEQST